MVQKHGSDVAGRPREADRPVLARARVCGARGVYVPTGVMSSSIARKCRMGTCEAAPGLPGQPLAFPALRTHHAVTIGAAPPTTPGGSRRILSPGMGPRRHRQAPDGASQTRISDRIL